MNSQSNRQSQRSGQYQTLALVSGGVFLSTMDSSMVNVALPFIMADFEAPLISAKWVVLIYLLSITVTLLFWGIAADRFGRFLIYFLGISLFLLSSAGCSLAPDLGMLIGIRFVEGLGAAMMMASGPAIIRDAFPPAQIGRGLGLVGVATSAGLMSGPVVGGLLINTFSWRAIFLACLPIGLIIIAGAVKMSRVPVAESVYTRVRRFDWKGAAFWALLITSLVLYAHFLPVMELFGRLGGALWIVLLSIMFYHAEKSRRSNILPLHLVPKSYYHIGLVTASLSFASLFGVLILMPFYLTHIMTLRADLVGLTMISIPLTLFVVSPTAGMLYDGLGSRYLTTLGLGVSTISLLLLACVGEQTSLVFVFVVLALMGMGQSIFLVPNTASLLSRIDDVDAGITAGLLATSRNLGMLAGAALGSMVFGSWFSYFSSGVELGSYQPALSGPFISALRATMLCFAVLSLINAAISWQRDS
jgi:MFS family permease